MCLGICQDPTCFSGERRRPDELGLLVEHLRAGGAIDIAPLHGDLDIDRAIGEDRNPGIRQIDLMRLCCVRPAEQQNQYRENHGVHDGVAASCSKVVTCCLASSEMITTASPRWIRA